ncbi:hypothetical protein [Pseudonocardia sp. MH-G8]|uniref:hypothetical protein n=1 Tax=Pseudonocardia sp. MH-G8 TaxID=1854588 RepID=UPI00130400FB|nr:hypothetical protein [Pseudonocardia sp. MH-G8]
MGDTNGRDTNSPRGLAEIAQQMRLTLLTATRAVEISAAAVLADVLGETAHRTR